jgi:membrane-associated phospholipid phosphatase
LSWPWSHPSLRGACVVSPAALVPDRARRRSLWALIALLAVGCAFGPVAATANRAESNLLDERASAWLAEHRADWPAVTLLAHGVTRVGNPEVAVPLVGLAALTLLVLHRRGVVGIGKGEAAFWVAVPLGGDLLDGVLKGWYERERPPPSLRLVAETSYSFPSGHSLFAAILFGLTAILLVRLLRNTPAWKRGVAVSLVLTPAVLIAASRVWLGVHYPTDVLGGLLLGSACLIAACLLRFAWPRRPLDHRTLEADSPSSMGTRTSARLTMCEGNRPDDQVSIPAVVDLGR